ncbi:MAG: DEAD/DEAH box helicase [Gammaproteobacteria bacterium]|nr:DEAD/DEAH box helicase [Gammaproteobacteria bacterium]
MLASPLFEHTFGWEPGDLTLDQLSGSLLDEQTVKALSETDNPDYRFDRAMKPYKHQLTAWQALTDNTPKSTVVTTGTGSGKTECFMVPILNDLIREQSEAGKPLVGVRALFLYPLNALINSQRERLDAWTAQQGTKIRYCLYNGNTEQLESKKRKEQRLKPNEVMSRELMRREPAPILMTNATMLEYMLVRQDDESIFSLSRDAESLRWIVLDEAHTYLGSQAAEISLLLRRVVAAFGKRAQEIRFIATSATIAGEDANDALRSYLASLAGVPESQVVVVTGKRTIPMLEHSPPEDLMPFERVRVIDADQEVSAARYKALSNHRLAYLVRNQILNASSPQSLADILESVGEMLRGATPTEQQNELFQWIDLMTATRPSADKEPFLKLRAHLFQRMLHGLWTCVDPNCSYKTEQLAKWPFGYVYTKQRAHCECGAPVYEFASCNECGTPHIVAEDAYGKLRQVAPYVQDEFSLQDDSVDSLDEQSSASIHSAVQPLIIAPRANSHYQPLSLDLETATLASTSATRQIEIHQTIDTEARCSECEFAGRAGGSFLRKAYLGAPFYVSNAVPTVLEFCPDPVGGNNPAALPGRGRKLITFTDSRQGTARMAVRMQQEAERSRLRGLVFEVLRNAQKRADSETTNVTPAVSIDELRASIAALEAASQFAIADQLKKQLAAAENMGTRAAQVSIEWSDMVAELAATNDMMYSILKYNRYTNPQLFPEQGGAKQLAALLLLREYARRPKNQNSTETLGLVEVGYRGIDKLTKLPDRWSETVAPNYLTGESKTLTLEDWHDFLIVALDFFVRENTFLTIDRDVQQWMGARFTPKSLLPPGSDDSGSTQIVAWPSCNEKGGQHRLVKILAAGAGFDLANSLHRDIIDRWLKTAWEELVRCSLLQSINDGYQLARASMTFQFPRKGYVCPVTNRLFARTFRGITPYLPNRFDPKKFSCVEVHLPNYAEFAPSGLLTNKVTEIRQLIDGNEAVHSLRGASLWTDISDRTVEGGYYYRTAEHSAQQASQRLERYEEDFKSGQINVLNCSTTMEMGVDIGGISAVVMNNVPPHPANYLQRAGRAGRRSESLAVSYTLCKADPHNARVFNDPKWPFTKRIPAPVVTLSAAPLIQRHVNAYLLAAFLRASGGSNDSTKLNALWFYGGLESRASRFIQWLKDTSFDQNSDLINILKGTALQAHSIPELFERASDMIKVLEQHWKTEAGQIESRLKGALEEPYKRALEHEKARHENEYLLKDLSARAFLPGHGFPTDLVTLNTANIEDFSARRATTVDLGREDNIFTFKAEPSRGLSMALREYAPGSTIVVDGRVYRSAGVKLQDYQQPGSSSLKFDLAWRCTHCGTTGYSEYAYSADDNLQCHECGSEIRPAEKRRVLRPMGFTTDFWENTTNNVTSQVFMPIVAPRVRVEGRQSSMPDPACGFVRYGEDGHIFYQSEGQYGNGYAVCLSCGRAESMTANGHVPDQLRADRDHRPIGGLSGSSQLRNCSGESVMQDIFLGYETRTHVLEWVPRNPINGSWLSDSDDDRIVATTLAVALRDEIAEYLGIESTEMGFSVRQERDTENGDVRLVVQVYDQVAGGAGFALSALNNLMLMVSGAIARLQCANNCDTSCSSCLASKDSRVEFEHINRLTALDWLNNSQYTNYLQLSPPLDSIEDAKYFCQKPITELVSGRQAINVSHVYLTLAGDQKYWELGSNEVRKVLSELVWGRNIPVTLRSEKEIDDSSQKEQLMLLARLGVGLCIGGHSSREFYPMLQAELKDGSVITLATADISESHGISWLTQNSVSPWIHSQTIEKVRAKKIDAASWLGSNSTKVIELTSKLNGPIENFPHRFESLIKHEAPAWMAKLELDPVLSIHYEDRYLKSPWSALLLAGVFWVFKSDALENVSITTHFKDDYGRPKWLWDNWTESSEYLTVMPKLFNAITQVPSKIDLKSNLSDVSHRRLLTLTLRSGKKVKCSFDQGMGYWNVHAPNPRDRLFDFGGSIDDQLRCFIDAWSRVNVTNSGTWPTHILLYDTEVS